MVSISKLRREELTTIIAQELHIDVAFPCFSVEEQYGSTACCVVNKHWLSTLRQSKIGEITKINKYVFTRSPSNNVSDQANDQQTSTTNVLVSVYLKRCSTDSTISKPQLYARNPSDNINSYDSSIFDERVDLPLRYFLKKQLEGKPTLSLADIEAQYNNYAPIFSDNDFQNAESLSELEVELARQKAFVKKFIEILYPESAYFRIAPQLENGDVLFVEAISQPEWSSDMPITTSPNIIDVFAVLESERAYYFMAPYRGTTLEDLLKYSSGVLDSNVKKSFIIYQLLRTVQSLHMRGVIHGGLKPSNILVDENLWVTLTGFECSVLRVEELTDKCNQCINKDFTLENIPKGI